MLHDWNASPNFRHPTLKKSKGRLTAIQMINVQLWLLTVWNVLSTLFRSGGAFQTSLAWKLNNFKIIQATTTNLSDHSYNLRGNILKPSWRLRLHRRYQIWQPCLGLVVYYLWGGRKEGGGGLSGILLRNHWFSKSWLALGGHFQKRKLYLRGHFDKFHAISPKQ